MSTTADLALADARSPRAALEDSLDQAKRNVETKQLLILIAEAARQSELEQAIKQFPKGPA